MQNSLSLSDLPEQENALSSSEEESVSSPFLSSLHELTPEDITPIVPEPEKERSLPITLIIRILVLILCVSVLGYSMNLLITQFIDGLEATKTDSMIDGVFWGKNAIANAYPDLMLNASPDYAASQTITDFSDLIKPPTFNEKVAQIKARLGALKEINKDVYGYIHIENTNIDYPLVQRGNNDFYLKHDFTGKWSSRGSIFVDFRNSRTLLDNRNTVIYGHHMTSGSDMFKTLDNYYDEAFFQNNPDITIYTFDGIYHFRVFAVYTVDMEYPYIQTHFASDEEFLAFCEEMRSNSNFVREGITFDSESHILTLSTCTNVVKTERLAVQAVLVSTET